MNQIALMIGATVLLLSILNSALGAQRYWRHEHKASVGKEWTSTLYIASGYFFSLAIAGFVSGFAISVGLLAFAFINERTS